MRGKKEVGDVIEFYIHFFFSHHPFLLSDPAHFHNISVFALPTLGCLHDLNGAVLQMFSKLHNHSLHNHSLIFFPGLSIVPSVLSFQKFQMSCIHLKESFDLTQFIGIKGTLILPLSSSIFIPIYIFIFVHFNFGIFLQFILSTVNI